MPRTASGFEEAGDENVPGSCSRLPDGGGGGGVPHRPERAHLLQRRPPDPAVELPDLPSAGRGRADVAHLLRAVAPVGAGDQERRPTAKQMPPWFADPELGVFSNERKLTRARNRDARGLGRRRRAGGQPERRAACRGTSRTAGTSSRTSSSRCRSRSSCRRPAPSTTSTSSSRRTSRKTCGSSPPKCGRATRRCCITAKCGCARRDRRG